MKVEVGGKTYSIGTRVRLANITDKDDLDLNGMIGSLAYPFRKFPIRDVGVRLDATECNPVKCRRYGGRDVDTDHQCHEQNVTVYRSEFEVI